jgi:hypothetical protein
MVPRGASRWHALEHAASGFVFQAWTVGIVGGLIVFVVLLVGLAGSGSFFASTVGGAGIILLLDLVVCAVIGLTAYGIVMSLLAKAETIRLMIAIEGHLEVIEHNIGGGARQAAPLPAARPGNIPVAPRPAPQVGAPLPGAVRMAPPQTRP